MRGRKMKGKPECEVSHLRMSFCLPFRKSIFCFRKDSRPLLFRQIRPQQRQFSQGIIFHIEVRQRHLQCGGKLLHRLKTGLMNALFIAINARARHKLIDPGKNAETLLRKALRQPCRFQALTKDISIINRSIHSYDSRSFNGLAILRKT